MKIFIFIAMILGCANGYSETSGSTYRCPLYVGEFLSKLGIDPVKLESGLATDAEVQRLIMGMDPEALLTAAKAARDEFTHTAFFRIEEIDGDFLVGKRYTLADKFVTLDLHIFRDATGKLARVAFSCGTQR
jgi:hypothetical protein